MRPLFPLLVAAAAVWCAAPLAAQDHDGHDHGDGAIPRDAPAEPKHEVQDRSLAGRIHRFGERLAERLADLERPAAEVDRRVQTYERTFRTSLDDPTGLRAVYQDRLRELRIRLEARGIRGEALESRLAATKAYYETWLARRSRPVQLPDPQG